MKQYKFKTNINCGSCVAAVTPILNGSEQIKSWQVDTANPNKLLSVETEELSEDQVESLISKAGFKAELVSE